MTPAEFAQHEQDVREACAKIADVEELVRRGHNRDGEITARIIAAAIRSWKGAT